MKFLNPQYLILVAIIFLIIDSFVPFSRQGMSDVEVEQAIKLSNLEQENSLLKAENSNYEIKLNNFINEKSKIDSITDGYSKPQIDSFYTNYFK